ncbi:MAG: hypothetical protein V1897_11205, partial [Pseudomonadota bacterium]
MCKALLLRETKQFGHFRTPPYWKVKTLEMLFLCLEWGFAAPLFRDMLLKRLYVREVDFPEKQFRKNLLQRV